MHHVAVSNKDFSTSRYCNREVSSEAESSQAARRPAKGEAYPDETREEAFQRNLKEVQAWRRRKEAFRELRMGVYWGMKLTLR